MSDVVIHVESLSKQYRLGTIGVHTMRGDLARWWAKQRGQPDPTLRIDQTNHGNRQGKQLFALQNINVEIKKGEVVGIIGHNGAGKSTLLKILSRVTTPTTGAVKVKGRIASLLEVGTGFHPELTGRENIYLNGAILGMRRLEIDNKFDEIVDFSGVEGFIDTPVKRYSSGMYVRLAFSVAAHLEPEILLVDEVLAVGDMAFQRKCLGKMETVAKEGRTVLFVSHNMSAVVSLCPRGILLDQGQVNMDADITKVASRYVSSDQLRGIYQKPQDKSKKLSIDNISLLKNGVVSTSFNNSDTLVLHIECSVREPIDGAQLAYEVFAANHECLFCSSNQDITGIKEMLNSGQYVFECPIDLTMFREGQYSIKVSSSVPVVEGLDVLETRLVFQLYDDSSPILKLGQNRRGIILPIMKWNLVSFTAQTT
ncbi:MAG: ABC transporter ATP-binding protein [Caldilinea sp. CFX5]|nr:ABC transporter ATP-binding protein [Caldilinea sp. CFX5]